MLNTLVAIRAEDIEGAALEARAPIEHSIPVVPIWPWQNVMYLDILQDRSNPGFVNICRFFDVCALFRCPRYAVGGINLPLVHHGRSPEVRFRRIGDSVVKILIGVVHENCRRERKGRVIDSLPIW